MANDEFYRQLRDRVSSYSGPYAEYVLLLPDLFVLLSRLMLDSRIESRHKAMLGGALAYFVSPIDLLPERTFGPIGYIDDLAILVAALNRVLNEVDPQIVVGHWPGKADLLSTVRRSVEQADQMIGKGRLDSILEGLGMRGPAQGPA